MEPVRGCAKEGNASQGRVARNSSGFSWPGRSKPSKFFRNFSEPLGHRFSNLRDGKSVGVRVRRIFHSAPAGIVPGGLRGPAAPPSIDPARRPHLSVIRAFAYRRTRLVAIRFIAAWPIMRAAPPFPP
jgi:hypothetical protein